MQNFQNTLKVWKANLFERNQIRECENLEPETDNKGNLEAYLTH